MFYYSVYLQALNKYIHFRVYYLFFIIHVYLIERREPLHIQEFDSDLMHQNGNYELDCNSLKNDFPERVVNLFINDKSDGCKYFEREINNSQSIC